jgi:hypothetical protein
LSLSLAVIGLILSFGPSPDGRWTAFSLFAHVPGLASFRAPARFALLVLVGLSMLVAFGVQLLRERAGRAAPIVLVLLPCMVSEWYLVGVPGGGPMPSPVPAIYALPAVRQAHALVSLPDYRNETDWFNGADYLYYSTAHWRPIVNGFGRAEPPGYNRVISHMKAFPGPNNAKTMRELGVDYVVFHAGRIPDGVAIAESASRMQEYKLVAQIDSDYLFQVQPAPQ